MKKISKFIAYCGLDCEKCEARTATVNNDNELRKKLAVKFLEKLGANFKRQFDAKTYEKFFADMGYENVTYELVRGRMSCNVAVIEVRKN